MRSCKYYLHCLIASCFIRRELAILPINGHELSVLLPEIFFKNKLYTRGTLKFAAITQHLGDSIPDLI